MPVEIEQHNLEIQTNAEHWRKKPLLREIYRGFYLEISKEVRRDLPGSTVEIGSGIGNLKDVISDAITTDLFANPWLDRIENAYSLSFADRSVANLVLFDVWHHLQYPGTALVEFHRVLMPGGRLIIFDPAMGMLGRIVFGLFHREPLGLGDEISWLAPAGFVPAEMKYYAAQGNAQRVFFSDKWAPRLGSWRIVRRSSWAAISYVASGGFSGPQLYPRKVLPVLRGLDRAASCLPALFATRLLVALEKKNDLVTPL